MNSTPADENISINAMSSNLGQLANSPAKITAFNESLNQTFLITVGLSTSLIV